MQDFIIGETGPIFYGFIAESEANAGHFVLAIRGTSSWVEWWDDFNAIRPEPFKDPGSGLVGSGFARIYDTLQVVTSPMESTRPEVSQPSKTTVGFAQQVATLVNSRRGLPRNEALAPSATIAVTGHSLGAALATLYVLDNALTNKIKNPVIYTFASPRVGDATFANTFNTLGLASWRIDNLPDIVPQMPLGYTHVNSLKQYDSLTTVWPSPSCWHSLATYLSLIDSALKPDPACQWRPPTLALATPHESPATAPKTVSAPSSPVTVNITVNVGPIE
jgi:hypothetical protein